MPLQIPAQFGVVTFELRLIGDPEPMFTTHGVDLEAAGVVHMDTLLAIKNSATAVNSIFAPAAMSNKLSLTKITLRVGPNPGGLFELPVTNVGTDASDILPNNCAYLYKKVTGSPGREGRGRMFIPGVPEAAVDHNGALSSLVLNDKNARAAAYLNLIASDVATPTPMVLLHTSDQIGGAPAPHTVVSLNCDPRIATQRRRLRR